MKASINLEDISQIAIGGFALAVPISFSEEAWKLGESLPIINLLFLFTLSLVFLSFYTYQGVFQGKIKNRVTVFIFRMLVAYIITVVIVSLILISINKFPLFSEPIIAIKRLVVISMPASMGAIVVDSFDKE